MSRMVFTTTSGSSYTLKYFMWGFQGAFHSGARVAAESVLQALDSRFKPEVFLVGFRKRDMENRLPVCVHPEDCPYQPEAFEGIDARVSLLCTSDPDSNVHYADSGDGSFARYQKEKHEERIRIRSLRKAIVELIGSRSYSDDLVVFCGYPAEVEGYEVFPVIQIDRHAYEACYRLRNGERDRISVDRNLIDAVIDKLFAFYCAKLQFPEPGAGLLDTNSAEIIRAAGSHLMYTPAVAGGNFEGLHGLYDTCDRISTLKYEGSDGIGCIVIARTDHPDVRVRVRLKTRIRISDYGAVRKLMQLADSRLHLICDSAWIIGLGHVDPSYDSSCEDIYFIRFKQQFVWELVHAEQVLMHVRFGQPQLRAHGFDREKFKSDIKRVYPTLSSSAIQYLTDLAVALSSQQHGAMLVISLDAEKEAERLKQQSTGIHPIPLTEDNLPWLSAIDGAILCDIHGNCHAIGVILDGMASEKCTPARGSRFNSAVRYATGNSGCVVIVKSEDGAVDVLPQMRSVLKKSELEGYLRNLRLLASADNVEQKEFNSAMTWLGKHRFYLLPEACDEVNRLRKEIEKRIKDDGGWKLVCEDYVAYPDMNETYLID